MDDEKRLIENILGGDQKSFEYFIEKYKKLVFHIVYRLIHNIEDREDICQEVFVKAYQNLGSFKNEAKLSTWLGRIAYNTSLNHISKKKEKMIEDYAPKEENLLEQIKSEDISPSAWVERKDTQNILFNEIEKLTEQQKTILSLYHWEEMSYEEIGEVMNLPMGTVKNYLFRARKTLKEQLERKYEEKEL